jgi:hypothetical protein
MAWQWLHCGMEFLGETTAKGTLPVPRGTFDVAKNNPAPSLQPPITRTARLQDAINATETRKRASMCFMLRACSRPRQKAFKTAWLKETHRMRSPRRPIASRIEYEPRGMAFRWTGHRHEDFFAAHGRGVHAPPATIELHFLHPIA